MTFRIQHQIIIWNYYVIRILYLNIHFPYRFTLAIFLFSHTTMNRLQNLSHQISQTKYHNFLNESKICPDEVKSIVFGPHYHHIQEIYQIIERNQTIFNHPDIEDQTRKLERLNATRQMLTILKNYKINDLKKDGYKFLFGLYGLVSYNLGLAIKTNIQYMLYLKTLVTYGTTQLHQQYVQKALNLEHLGCFALTELHHGSYTKGIATEAVYNHEKRVFELSTHGNQGMKFWIGGSAQIANMAVIWAQVVVKGVSYGPHPFVVQARDFKTHDLMPGVIIGDCGDKFGLNGIDNGYFILEGLIVPKQNLLNGLGGVDEKGNYASKVKSDEKRFGLHMSPLSSGRAALAYCSLSCSTNALAIASKYVCQRRQFSNPSNKSGEQSILIDYPLTKFRLVPLIAQSFVYYIGGLFIAQLYTENADIFTDSENPLVQQMHAVSAVLKAKSTWFANNVITECRQLLGGHGYSSFSRLGRLFADNNVHSTWEGDNNMLLQQTSKYLLKCALTQTKCSLINLEFIWQNKEFDINFQQLDCLQNLQKILQTIIRNKLIEVKSKMVELKAQNMGAWEEWNALQPHFCNGLSLSFGDYIYFKKAQQALATIKHKQTGIFLEKCIILWTLRTIESQRYGKYDFRTAVQQKILDQCSNLTGDCMKFIQSTRPPNFIIDSPFVKVEPMKEYVNLFMTGSNTFKRVDWYGTLLELRNSQ